MSEDPFLDSLRDQARRLRYEPAEDDLLWTRLSARIRDRIAGSPPSVAELLSRWIRPVAAAFSALALAGLVAMATIPAEQDSPALTDGGAQITVAGDSYNVGD
jgi:hypothetical protein